jgi:sigma-B regulation protein RsbU (phosphoserine phosphatase)
VIALDDDHFSFLIADVSDKGMPAALYMALSRSLLLAEARCTHSPRAVLTNVNRLLMEMGSSGYVSVFYGVVERTTRRLAYTRAGHDRPLLLHRETVQPLGGKGIALGVLDDIEQHLSEEEIHLAPGDRLVLYTDGLTDALTPDGEFYGLDRLESLFQSYACLTLGEMCAATFRELTAHKGSAEQFDGMTMLVLEVK